MPNSCCVVPPSPTALTPIPAAAAAAAACLECSGRVARSQRHPPAAGEEGGPFPQEHDGQARQLCVPLRCVVVGCGVGRVKVRVVQGGKGACWGRCWVECGGMQGEASLAGIHPMPSTAGRGLPTPPPTIPPPLPHPSACPPMPPCPLPPCTAVISPDVFLNGGEIGVPPYFAARLSYPERVRPQPLAELRGCAPPACAPPGCLFSPPYLSHSTYSQTHRAYRAPLPPPHPTPAIGRSPPGTWRS